MDMGGSILLNQIAAKYAVHRSIQSLRLSKLTGGEDKAIPDMNVFISNSTEGHEVPQLSSEDIEKITSFNNFGDMWKHASIFGLISLINHSKEPNVSRSLGQQGQGLIHAARDIQQGEEIFIDYIEAI